LEGLQVEDSKIKLLIVKRLQNAPLSWRSTRINPATGLPQQSGLRIGSGTGGMPRGGGAGWR
jgi:hypothetical protein